MKKFLKRSRMKTKILFWIFAPLKNISLGVIIFIIFHAFEKTSNIQIIGLDTRILLSVLFPLLTLIIEYMFFESKGSKG